MTPRPRCPQTGDALRHWREARGYTQAELAKIFGVTPQTILRIENGHSRFQKVYGMACGWLDVHTSQHVHS